MNPQPDNNLDPLTQGARPLPQSQPTGQLNVPPRAAPTPMHDYDESAFAVDSTPPPPIREATPAPSGVATPSPIIQQQAPPQAPPPIVRPPEPISAPIVAASPPPAMAPPQPPAVAPQPMPARATSLEPPIPTAIPPVPVTPIDGPAPLAAPIEEVSGPHTDPNVIERIDEKPQQNSQDIEELIEKNHRLGRLKGFASFSLFVVGVIIAAFLINQFIFQSYYVDGTSMTPTLQNDDRLIIDKVERSASNLQGMTYVPQRGQIVVLDSSLVGFNGREEQLIKRVVGLPGDTISISDGVVTIKNKENPDGFNFDKKFNLNLKPTYVESPQEWTIDSNHLFVMGDNRAQNGSYDSRSFGPVESNKIVGRLWARILPFDKAQIY